jgi:hypothetical protein
MRVRSSLLPIAVGVFVFSTAADAQDSKTAQKSKAKVQAATEDADDDAGASDEQAEPASPPEAEATVEGETATNAPETYTVQPGDTLWNLSQRFLNNAWYWPKIWSYNPKLENPNWIRPGSVIRFYPSGDDAAVAVGDQPRPEEEGDDDGGGDDFDDVPRFEKAEGLDERLRQLTEIQGAKRRREFFIPAERVEDAGVVQNSPEEKQLLSIYDGAYVRVKNAHVGDRLQVYREGREVRNPVTGDNVGRVVTILGEVDVETVGKEQALARVSASWDPIERGDFVSKLPTQNQTKIEPSKNTKAVRGYLVDAAPSPLSAVGEQYLVILDKGTKDGVKLGNTFIVVRGGDPYTRQKTGLLDEDIGEILVLETFQNASTGIVMRSNRELLPGDRIEMRPGN